MEKKETIRLRAQQAIEIAEADQERKKEMIYNLINDTAKAGFREVILFGVHPTLETLREFMMEGYTVSTFTHPFEQREMYKIKW